MTALEVLEGAKALIEDKSHWTRGRLAVNRHGQAVQPSNKAAVKWCAVGALYKAGNTLKDTPEVGLAFVYLEGAAAVLFDTAPAAINDYDGHDAVMELYDAAIVEARENAS